MKKRIYGVMNLSFSNPNRKGDYLLVKEEPLRATTFSFPEKIEDFGYIYPVDHVKFIAGDSSAAESEQYTAFEINLKVDEMANEVERYLAELIRMGNQGSVDIETPSEVPNTMILQFLPVLS